MSDKKYFEEGKYYVFDTQRCKYFIKKGGSGHIYPENKHYSRGYDFDRNEDEVPRNIREADPSEVSWIEACIKADMFVAKPDYKPEIIDSYSIF